MPTWKWMFAQRVPVTLCVVIACLFVPSVAGATTTTTPSAPSTAAPTSSTAPTTSTTLPALPPPPPAFTLPTDFGFQLIQQQEAAKADMAAARSRLVTAKRKFVKAQRQDKKVQAQLAALRKKADRTARKLDQTRDHLRAASAQAYMHAGNGDLAAALSSLTSTNDAVDVASQLHIISRYGSSERNALDKYLDLKAKLDHEVAVITDLADRAKHAFEGAKLAVAVEKNTILVAGQKIADTLLGIAKFEEAATSALSPILGPARLSANQMADFLVFNHSKPHITVPLRDLAQYYLDEGAKLGVRGDVAFAQSILETGGFANPGAAATDNNFAGIGWCDSCAHGFNFPNALIGVRAQLQLLRTYVDPNFPDLTYKDPILLPGTLKLGFRGKVQTWWDLWGTWATAALYGQRVYDLYEKMVKFAALDPPQPRVEPLQPTPGDDKVTRPPASGPGTLQPKP
jgi:hypothetical protein